jgi:hypothetical protein
MGMNLSAERVMLLPRPGKDILFGQTKDWNPCKHGTQLASGRSVGARCPFHSHHPLIINQTPDKVRDTLAPKFIGVWVWGHHDEVPKTRT